MDLRALIGSVGEELAEKIAKIDHEVLVQLTVGSHEAGARLRAQQLRATPEIAAELHGPEVDDDFWNFSKAGDGFINVWGQAPPPKKLQ